MTMHNMKTLSLGSNINQITEDHEFNLRYLRLEKIINTKNRSSEIKNTVQIICLELLVLN